MARAAAGKGTLPVTSGRSQTFTSTSVSCVPATYAVPRSRWQTLPVMAGSRWGSTTVAGVESHGWAPAGVPARRAPTSSRTMRYMESPLS